MSQYFYAIRTSCHLLNLITGFTRGVITSWYQCRFVSCLWHSPCFITLPSALFWFFFCRCLFICHPGTSGTNTLGPGLPCLWLALLGAGSGPLQHRQGEGAECHSHPLPRIPLCRDAEFIAAVSPVNLPSLLTLAPGNLGRPRTAQTHRRRQPVPPRQYYLPKPGGGRTHVLSASVQPWHRDRATSRVTWRGDEASSPCDTQSIVPRPGQNSHALPPNPNNHGAPTQQYTYPYGLQRWIILIAPALAIAVGFAHCLKLKRSLCVLSLLGKAPGQKQSGLFLPYPNSPSHPIHTRGVR